MLGTLKDVIEEAAIQKYGTEKFQRELARNAGLSNSTVSRIMREDGIHPDTKTIRRLADSLGIDYVMMLYLNGDLTQRECLETAMPDDMDVELDEGAFMPEQAYDGDAGYDLRTPERVVIHPHYSRTIDTGVHIAIPFGYFGKLESKSGLMVNADIESPGGVIDHGYTGSIRVKLRNNSGETFVFNAGEKIVQMIIQPHLSPKLNLVDKLKEKERGDRGFGSSGV